MSKAIEPKPPRPSRSGPATPANPTTCSFQVSDQLWEVLAPLLPQRLNTHPLGGGRPRVPDRTCANGIFCKRRSESGPPGRIDRLTLWLSLFRINVRLSVRQKCHPVGLRWYQMKPLWMRWGTAASAGFPHRCIFSPCLCESPTPSPSLEWTTPGAWPAAPPSISPSAGMSAFSVMALPAIRSR